MRVRTRSAALVKEIPALSCGGSLIGCSRVQYSRSADFGQTWIPPITLVADGTSVFPWLDARGSKVSVALYHTDAVGTPDTVPPVTTEWVTSYPLAGIFGPETCHSSAPVINPSRYARIPA